MHRKAGVRWAGLSDGEAAATPEKQRVFKMHLNREAGLLLRRAEGEAGLLHTDSQGGRFS